MRRERWSVGVVVAIAVAISVATAGWASFARGARASAPVGVTLALRSDGVALHIVHERLALTVRF